MTFFPHVSVAPVPLVPFLDTPHVTAWRTANRKFRIDFDKASQRFELWEREPSCSAPDGYRYELRMCVDEKRPIQDYLGVVLYPVGAVPSPETAIVPPDPVYHAIMERRLGRDQIQEHPTFDEQQSARVES